MLKAIIIIIWCLLFAKTFFFWVWLWQLKEYHWGRFKAHFETQRFIKIVSGFWRVKFPRLTLKTLGMLLYGLLFAFVVLIELLVLPEWTFYLALAVILILTPAIASLVVLLFQGPTVVLRNKLLEKARQKRESFKNPIVIGITGSYGKTSTKEFLAAILTEKFRVLKTEKHINAEIGIAQTILRKLTPRHEIFIAEIGAYERGKIREVCQMLQPKIGILTGINEQHLATFGSQENIIKAKFELIEALPGEGVAVFNGDNQYISNLKSQISNLHLKSKIFCSAREKTDTWTEDVRVDKEWLSFRVFAKDGDRAEFRVNLAGRQNVENILLAAACAKELGMSLQEVAMACRKIRPEQGSMLLKRGVNGRDILDSTYSANLTGVLADLEHLKLWSGKKVIIMPCLIELGSASKEVHSKIGEKIGEVCDLAIITTKDRFKELREGATRAGMAGDKILLIERPNQIFKKLKGFVGQGDVVLLESRIPSALMKKLVNG